MYIRRVKKQNIGAEKSYEYLHLVENIRTSKGPRQRLILNLGVIDVSPEKYKELANTIEAMLNGQQSLFPLDHELEPHARQAVRDILAKQASEEEQKSKAQGEAGESAAPSAPQPEFVEVDVSTIEAGESRSLGPEYVGHNLYKELGINDVLLAEGVSPHTFPVIEALVLGRLICPSSERQTREWVEHRSALYELTGRPLKGSLNSFYRGTDVLLTHKDALEAHLSIKERDLFNLSETLCFFDLTNTHFEGQALGNPKAKFGRSKQKRSDCRLLTLALIVDGQGFVKCSRLYPGNQQETKTLSEMITSLVALRPEFAENRTVIMDAGIATADNTAWLKDNHFHYIVVNRGKTGFTPEDTTEMTVIRHEESYTIEVLRKEHDDEALLLCRSTKRIEKDKGIRNRQEQLFEERLTYFRDGLSKKGHTRAYAKVLTLVGRLREKYPRASKVYDVEVVPEVVEGKPAKTLVATDILWKKKTAHEQDESFDGCYVLRTDRTDLTDKEIWQTYVMLTRVESAFQSMKSSLGLRPNFHQIERRADAHLFISVLAYHILHAIEHRLRQSGDNRCWNTIRQVLSTHQRLTLEYDVKDGEVISHSHLRLSTRPEPEHMLIYKKLGLSGLPLGRHRFIAK